MLVYGDHARHEHSRRLLARILATEDRETALIAAGQLAQGLADAEYAALGHDEDTPIQRAAMSLAVAIARGDRGGPEGGTLAALPLPDAVQVKTPEGYAFYAVYPETYARAAAAHRWGSPPFVIGLRSIGASLAAVVAAATGARDVITVRPTGHPFRRELRLSPALESRMAAHCGPFAIVDEGPGLSGSSFGAAADRLEALGVGRERIVFMPAHGNDLGPQGSAAHRARWQTATRLLPAPLPPIGERFRHLIGQVRRSEDVPGSVWKARLTTDRGDFIARFAGLGGFGGGKFNRAKALHAAGFGPETLALRQGLLLQRWIEGEPARPSLEHLSGYLRFRRDSFPASPGADPATLKHMAQVNTAELLGEAAGRALGERLDRLPLLNAQPRAVHVDARLHAPKWRRAGDRIIKLDALDHSEAHDLVGPQDIAWDVAGAAVELDLSDEETRRLAEAVGADPIMLALSQAAYPAFQAGLASFRGEPAAPYAERLARLASVAESAE